MEQPYHHPQPPDRPSFGDVWLRFVALVPGDPSRGFVSYYQFRIMLSATGEDVGRINFRVGDTHHVTLVAGHIGYEIAEAHRGHGYSLQACRAIAPFVASIYPAVIITCDPDNIASRTTIERLGSEFLDEVEVPEHEPAFTCGSRFKRRYLWTL